MASILDGLRHVALPALVLTFFNMAGWVRYTRASMLEVLRQDYMRTARAKGLKERVVILKHGLRNALIPLITILALTIPGLFGGAIITETIFSWPGMGRMQIDAIASVDWPVVQGLLVIEAFLVIFSNLWPTSCMRWLTRASSTVDGGMYDCNNRRSRSERLEPAAGDKPVSQWGLAWRRLRRHKLAMIGLVDADRHRGAQPGRAADRPV